MSKTNNSAKLVGTTDTAIQISDISPGNSGSAGSLATPVISVSGNTSSIQFVVESLSGFSASGDSAGWVLYGGAGFTTEFDKGSITSDGTITTTTLAAGSYRLVFNVTDDSSNNKQDATLQIDSIRVVNPSVGNILSATH